MVAAVLPLTPEPWATAPATDSVLLLEQLATLRLENAALQERIRELEARLVQTSANSSRPPSADPFQAPARPKAPCKPLRSSERRDRGEGSIMSTSATIKEVMRELATLEDPKMREVNERRGDDHGVNLTQLRALAKRLKPQHELALQLWATGDTAARLLATLVCRPKAFSTVELNAMICDIRSPKLLDWFIVNVVKPGRHAEELRLGWKDGGDLVGRAGWDLTSERVVKSAEGLDLDVLLDQIEKEMKQAPTHKQWAMNHCLAEIGIHHPELRGRAIGIGERLAVLTDYPASPGCTPPYAPIWIAEIVRRREETQGQ